MNTGHGPLNKERRTVFIVRVVKKRTCACDRGCSFGFTYLPVLEMSVILFEIGTSAFDIDKEHVYRYHM